MTDLNNIIGGMIQPRSPREDEYFNEADGLIYCRKCGTPRQTRIVLMGKEVTPTCMCACRTEAYERENEEYTRRAEANRIRLLKANGLQDKALYDYRFERDDGRNPPMAKIRRYVSHWPEMKKRSQGLLLWGDVGTGKSFAAGCIANALLDRGNPVLMTNLARLLNEVTGIQPDQRNSYIDSLNRYDLLIIDDLGMERSTEFAQEQVFNLIDSRYRSKKPFIVTTNLTLEEMENPVDLSHARIYDRVLERCVPVRFIERNYRREQAQKNTKWGRTVLAE